MEQIVNEFGTQDMERLSMCRICLATDVRMRLVINSHVQEIYEALTLILFETKDNRPVKVCYICFAKLENCYQLKNQCLRSEKLFTQMLNGNTFTPTAPGEIPLRNGFSVTPVMLMSMGHEISKDIDELKMEISKLLDYDKIKIEDTEVEDAPNLTEQHQSLKSDDLYLRPVREEPVYITSAHDFKEEDSLSIHSNPEVFNEYEFIAAKDEERLTVTDKDATKNDIEYNTINDNLLENRHQEKESTSDINGSKTEKRHTCEYCNKSFSSGYFKIHVRKHKGTLHNCSKCPKHFLKKRSLLIHLKSHTGEKPYQCNVCYKGFTTKKELSKHKVIHPRDCQYQCQECEKHFKTRHQLLSHYRVHTGEKPYECHLCQKRFTFKPLLKCHLRTHTGEKPYQCNLCEKAFVKKCRLKEHINLHTDARPYKCDICQNRFRYKVQAQKHIQIHTLEKRHECDICKKCFSTSWYLRKHVRCMHEESTSQ